jgi:hypothetical protein
MDFGNIQVGSTFPATLVISNTGNSPLTITGVTFPSNYTSTFTSGTIPAGGSQSATIRFSPTAPQTYNGTLTVNGDQTSGTNTVTISGTGVPAPAPATYALSGLVNDGTSGASGRIPNVTVKVVDGANTGKSAITDASGNYAITGLAPGRFTLSASATDFQTATKTDSLSANTTVDFALVRTPAPSPTPSPARRTDTFAFTLPAGSPSVVVGPVRAGNGPLEVALNFSGNFIILACVGTPAACKPMGGRPTTTTFNIPSDVPAGPIQAIVYFNPNAVQPSGNASGTVSFTYNPF